MSSDSARPLKFKSASSEIQIDTRIWLSGNKIHAYGLGPPIIRHCSHQACSKVFKTELMNGGIMLTQRAQHGAPALAALKRTLKFNLFSTLLRCPNSLWESAWAFRRSSSKRHQQWETGSWRTRWKGQTQFRCTVWPVMELWAWGPNAHTNTTS